MKRQYIRLFSFLIGITFILSGVIFFFVNNYKQDKKAKIEAEIKLADEISEVYETFYNKEKELSTYRDETINEVKDFSSYYTEMPKGYDDIIPLLEKYEELLTEIENGSSFLQEKCTVRYSVLDANDKCDAYYINLEKSINIFVGDIEYFNGIIKNYNEWTEIENKSLIATDHYDTLELFTAKKYTDYVDLNNDGTKLGMKGE